MGITRMVLLLDYLLLTQTAEAAVVAFIFNPQCDMHDHTISYTQLTLSMFVDRMESSPMLRADDATECPICTEVLADPRVLPCIHTYCKEMH